jgi:hypothetical protein
MTEQYYIEQARVQAITDKAASLTRWLTENAPDCERSQKHLEEGTTEQAYWHYGYLCAIRDVLAVIDRRSAQ